MIFSFLLLAIGSILTDMQYLWIATTISIGLFFLIFFLIHFSQKKLWRIVFICFFSILIVAQSISFIVYHDENIVFNTYGLTVYKGIPIPFFDILIHPNRSFRLIDKKHSFNIRDKNMLNTLAQDILLIGSGSEGLGGKGFPEDVKTQFQYNPVTNRGLQIIILKTPEAVKIFNRLKSERKNVLFIIHNTC